MNENVEIFCCYAREDQLLLLKLRTHLALLEREGFLNIWHDIDISPGTEWAEEIDKHLNTAHIILLLISPAFMASEYCYSKEMKRAMERHECGEACVIPILLRPGIWQEAPFAKLQVLPNNARAVTEWRNRDKALSTIAQGIGQIAKEQITKRSMVPSQQPQSTINTNPESIAGIMQRDWGEAPDIPVFFGRTKELILLEQWITEDRCRLVAIVGMRGIGKTRLSVKLGRGGIGKTDLSLKLAQGIQERFDYVIWRRLLNAPKVSEILTDLIKFLSNQQEINVPVTVNGQISRLLYYLHKHRCLVILDNVEMILRGGEYTDQYSQGYEEYGQLFKQVAEAPHQSCLLLTSREKPPEIANLASKTSSVRSLELTGLHYLDSKKIFAEIGSFSGSKEEWKKLNSLYNGNPLALELSARHIKEVFFGNISEFLREDQLIFADLGELLSWHFNRLSDLHREIMYWLAINREPTSLPELKEEILSVIAKEQVPSTLQSLQLLIPLEKSTGYFSLQPVFIEYMTEKIVKQVIEEINNRTFEIFNSHALLKALAKDHVRESQSRLILKPITERLLEIWGSLSRFETQIKQILIVLREGFLPLSGYAAGNVLNMLCQMKINISNYDFSSLPIRQAYLQETLLVDVNFTSTNFIKCSFRHSFGIIPAVAINRDGQLLALGTSNSEIWLWHMPDYRLIRIYKGHRDWIWSAAFSPDGRTLASGSGDQTIRLWDTTTHQCLAILYGHQGAIRAFAFTSNQRFFASGSSDHTIRIWDITTKTCVQILQGHTHRVSSLIFYPDNHTLVSGSFDHTIRIWDIDTSNCLQILQDIYDVTSLAISPDGKVFASGSSTITLWEVSTGHRLRTLEGHTNAVNAVVFSPDGKWLASGGRDHTIRIWDINTGKCLQVLQGHSFWIWSLAFRPHELTLVSGGRDQTVRIWNTSTGYCVRTLQGYIYLTNDLTFSPNGQFLANAGTDHMLRIWDVQTGNCLRVLCGHVHEVNSVAFSPNGHWLASCSNDQTVRIWDIHTGNCHHIMQDHSDSVNAVAFSSDGRILVSASNDQTIRVWDVELGKCIQTMRGHTNFVSDIAFSPDGKWLASGSFDQTVRIWDMSTGELHTILRGHTGYVMSIAYDTIGNFIASGSFDQTVRIWDINTGQCIYILHEHNNQINSIAASSDWRLLASASDDGTVRIWETSTGQCVHILQEGSSQVDAVTFSPDTEKIATGSADGTIRFWDVQSGVCVKTLRVDRPYERMNITGALGLTNAEKSMIKELGAIEK